MRRQITIALALLALILGLGPAMAQDATDAALQERTNPNADSHAGDSGLTIVGTVQEIDDEQLVLNSATGVVHIRIDDQTTGPRELAAGSQVTVDYTRTGQGVMIARQIRPEGLQAEAEVAETPVVVTEVEAETNELAETDVAVTPEPETFDESDRFDTEERLASATTSDEELPQTGSDLPAIALLGLIGLAGAGALRRLQS
jgi:LPXTG-motif cell wall-anchored protein